MAKRRAKMYGYLRVSSPGQVKGHGLKRQREAVEAYAKANGINVVGFFEDRGVSGTNGLEARAGLGALFNALEQNGVAGVIIERLNRLARDLAIQELIIKDIQDKNYTLVSVDDGPDLAGDDPNRKLHRQIMGAIAEHQKTMLVLKLRASRDAVRAETGRCEGKHPFGYYDGEAETVRYIKSLHRARKGQRRMGTRKIARILNDEGVKSRSGVAWSAQTIQNIVDRPTPKG